ncbi:MAG: hypothetical protein KDC11_13715 [Chitinophagaceae bacterium]|nr:hypothetical protein [Chitinophagaceae bacterium]
MKQLILTVSIFFSSVSLYAQPYLLVLGTAQDGGYPHMGCKKECCTKAWNNQEKIFVVSLALVNPDTKQWWLFEATPDIKEQLHYFAELTNHEYKYLPDGIFITHAHMGHYTGLMQLGREALGAKGVNVYALPKLKHYLETNGPWSQLVTLKNIELHELSNNSLTGLTKDIKVKTFTVPHRDEYSETAGFKIITQNKKYLFIPDINKWDVWQKDIRTEVQQVDIALLDATFHKSDELPGVRMDEVPHPYVVETMQKFTGRSDEEKAKIHFIHMNHTNPLLWNDTARTELIKSGYKVALQGMKL